MERSSGNKENTFFDKKDSVIALVNPMRNSPTKLSFNYTLTFQTFVFELTCYIFGLVTCLLCQILFGFVLWFFG